MECQQIQDWLLQTEDPHPARCTSPEVATHLRRCTPCRGLAGRLVRLEDAWRSIPTPARADEVRAAFLERCRRNRSRSPHRNRCRLPRRGRAGPTFPENAPLGRRGPAPAYHRAWASC